MRSQREKITPPQTPVSLVNEVCHAANSPPQKQPRKPYTGKKNKQVYKATLVSGEVVAVKVQRPDVLESVTLDLYVIRLILLFISKNDSTRESALSILGVIDNWADRFLQELDYLQEAANGDRFVLALWSVRAEVWTL